MSNDNIWKSINRGEYEETEPHKVEFYLNWELAQCKSKTEKTLNFIALEHHKTECITNDNKIKLISILFANNSLIEAAAWKSRSHIKFNLNNSNKKINIRKLSSAKNSDYINCKDLKASFMSYVNPKNSYNNFGDVLIMCNHKKRNDDIIDFLKYLDDFDGFKIYTNHKFRFNIFFDEYDQSKLYTQGRTLIQKIYDNELSYMINAVQYISATQHEDLIPDLKKITNNNDLILHSLIDNVGYKKDKDYKTIIDKDFVPHEGPEDPVEYVKSIHKDHPEIFKSGKVYFVPSATRQSSHEEMADLDIWKDLGLWTLILNGKNKEFRSPVGKIEKIDLSKKLMKILLSFATYLLAGEKSIRLLGLSLLEKSLSKEVLHF